MREWTLGSLFDGSGTCPLAGWMYGIRPIWASEIEEYPIRVTKKNFPEMKHLGDITKINGAEIEPVDIICGGSPCQDLSTAGKRDGLQDGERSHLFFEMTRIIKEMREATNGEYPRFILWENVPGALSSGRGIKGEDFLAVIQNFAEIADPFVYVPEPEIKSGKYQWKNSGYLDGDDWSLAWRIVDSQWFGVPQRRRRILMAVDLGRVSRGGDGHLSERHTGRGRTGGAAAEILFKRPCVFRHYQEKYGAWKGFAGDPSESSGTADSG